MPKSGPSPSSFTLHHPLVSIFFLSIAVVIFEFALYFPPLILWFGKWQEWISFTLIPIFLVTVSGWLLVGCLLHKLLPPVK